MKPLLPSPLPFNWPMKPLESARTNFSRMPYGSYELTITATDGNSRVTITFGDAIMHPIRMRVSVAK